MVRHELHVACTVRRALVAVSEGVTLLLVKRLQGSKLIAE
jgi:hypothetical protein